MEMNDFLRSDDEDSVDLSSDGEDTTQCSDSTQSSDSDDPDFHYHGNSFRQQPLHSLSTTSDSSDDEGPTMTNKDFPRGPMTSMTSVIDFDADSCPEYPEKSYFTVGEKAVYEDALLQIGQEKGEDDLTEGVLSVSLLKHQKIALAWMVSRENSTHCSGGILADDQGLGKTISMIALIQKERHQQSRFMTSDSELEISADDGDKAVHFTDKKELKARASLSKAVKAQSKKKTGVSSTTPTMGLRPTSRPAAGTLVVCPASLLKQWAKELSEKVTQSAKLSVLVYHGVSRIKDPTELAEYDVVITTYEIVSREVPKETLLEGFLLAIS